MQNVEQVDGAESATVNGDLQHLPVARRAHSRIDSFPGPIPCCIEAFEAGPGCAARAGRPGTLLGGGRGVADVGVYGGLERGGGRGLRASSSPSGAGPVRTSAAGRRRRSSGWLPVEGWVRLARSAP